MSWVARIRRFFSKPEPPPAQPARVFSDISWQERVRQVQLPPDERFPVYSLAGPSGPPDAISHHENELIKGVLSQSGLSAGRPEDIEFYRKAFDAGMLNGRDVRKVGKAISADEKRAMGISYRGILSREFLSTLNDKGLADPALAAELIARPAFCRISSAKSIKSSKMAGIENLRFRFGGMAAGHCSFSRKMEGKNVPIGQAEPLPAVSCEHPDQCGCRWQTWLAIMDELGID